MIALRSARLATRSLRRFASTQAAVEEAAATARGVAKEGAAEAKGAFKQAEGTVKGAAQQAEGTVKGAAQQAKAAMPSAPSAPIVVGSPTIRRPVGSVRGGVLGFLFGFGIASAYGYYYLLKEYNAASNLMLASVEELQTSTEKVNLPPFPMLWQAAMRRMLTRILNVVLCGSVDYRPPAETQQARG